MSEALDIPDGQEGYKEVEFGPKTFIVPEDWSVERFGDVFTRRSESIDADGEETIRYVGLKHINSGELKITDYDEDGQERSSSRAFKQGDILFGKLRPNLEKAAVAPFDGICSSDIIPIYSEDETLSEYLPYLMHSKLVRDRVVSTMEGTNLPRTSWSDLSSTLVPIPPKNERRHIVSVLSTVDERIQETEKAIKKTEELEKGLARDLFRTGVDEYRMEPHQIGPREYDFPYNWEVRAVGELLDEDTSVKSIRGGPPGGKISKDDRTEQGPKVYVQENIIYRDYSMGDEYLSEEKFEELKNAALEPGDVVITRAGTVGETDVFPESAQRGIMDSSLIRLKVDKSLVRPAYLASYISDSPISKFQIESMSHSGTRININNQIVKSLSVPLPPIEEQDKINDVLETCRTRVEQERETKQTLQELKQGLMQDLLTGNHRLRPDK